MTAPMLGRTTFPTSRPRDFCSRKELITAAAAAFLEGDVLVDLIDTKVTTMGITKLVPDPDVMAPAYRRACQFGTLNHALGAAAEDARGPCRPRADLPRRASRGAVGQRHRRSRRGRPARRPV